MNFDKYNYEIIEKFNEIEANDNILNTKQELPYNNSFIIKDDNLDQNFINQITSNLEIDNIINNYESVFGVDNSEDEKKKNK